MHLYTQRTLKYKLARQHFQCALKSRKSQHKINCRHFPFHPNPEIGAQIMADLKDRILDLFQAPCLSALATITTDGLPWVRYVMMEGADDLTFRCATFVNARKVAQIAANPEVHVTCGIGRPTDMGPYLQIQGKAEVATDSKARKAFWSDRLSAVFKGPDDPNLGVVTVRAYRIEVCKVGSKPEVWVREA
jgi:general stress protein 26